MEDKDERIKGGGLSSNLFKEGYARFTTDLNLINHVGDIVVLLELEGVR